MEIQLKVDGSKLALAMASFRLGLAQRDQLMNVIGAGQLVSVRRTFAESGSPSGSWRPLSPASFSWRKYSAGHKLLINTGLMLNSISYQASESQVTVGTAMAIARVHQFGFTGSQTVRPYSYVRRVKTRDRFGRTAITDKNGHGRTVRRKLSSGIATVHVNGFTRHISIPARPFLVFRPEDPESIATQVKSFLVSRAAGAGLEAS